MFQHSTINGLDDFFASADKRGNGQAKKVYFYRITGFNNQIEQFIKKYYEAARLSGVVIEGKIPNPDEKNLNYYQEIMSDAFELSRQFIEKSLKKWLPRMNSTQINAVGESLFNALKDMESNGKNYNMLKNAYIKFMCWLYYKFERIMAKLGESSLPKILYEGEISKYELMIISILSNAGCDVILLEYNGDDAYLKLDPQQKMSTMLNLPNMQKFPKEFSLKAIRENQRKVQQMEKIYITEPEYLNCTNAWITGSWQEDCLKAAAARGDDKKLYYNCFYKIDGVEDTLTYENELYSFWNNLKSQGRRAEIINAPLAAPTVDEIGKIRRGNYSSIQQMVIGLSSNIKASSEQLRRLTVKAFTQTLMEASEDGSSLGKLTGMAVYMLCWLEKYKTLFSGWKMPEVGCLIYFGCCPGKADELFLKMMAKLPVDVIILDPDLNTAGAVKDSVLFEKKFSGCLTVKEFPMGAGGVATAAYQAQRQMDTLLYEDSGIYRNQQYSKADAVVLKTMYEEIFILWNEELKYRPNFSTVGQKVNMPVIFAKVSGVKDGNVHNYWDDVKKLAVDNTFVISKAPFIKNGSPNPMKSYAAEFLKNGKLQREKIKAHKEYRYGFLREQTQEHMLDKLQKLIDSKIIKGTFENGMEYTITATVLNLNMQLLRIIQSFDFTKKNPKIVYINTTEEIISAEDSIVTSFLSLIGFDVIFFVPTGYRCVENHFNGKVMEEYQIGEYVYDLMPPEITVKSGDNRKTWRDKIFKRGQ